MKAVVHRTYGSPDVLAIEEIDTPAMADDAVLVRVRASSVNAFDWHMMRGQPYMVRPSEGWRRPRTIAMGVDVAGVVEAVGRDVTDLRPGDAVFGSRHGAFAELVSGRTFVPMPDGLSFEEAAAVPTAACTALQALRDKGHVQPGQRVLVTGAGGGVGTFALQLARALGARVTATTSSAKVDVVAGLGAAEVIDARRADYTRVVRDQDLVIDVAGDRPLSRLMRVLTPEGVVVMVGPGSGQWIGPILRVASATVRSRLGRRQVRPFLAKVSRDDLLVLKELLEAGTVRPVIDKVYPLSGVREAMRRVEANEAAGKVVITI